MSVYDKYETVIGLEVHVQLATHTKAFCGDSARFGGAPNTHISAISLAYPGTLPFLNEKQVEYAVKLGLALNSKINSTNCFDRKNYFYADLPKGYQITQDRAPICMGGSVSIQLDDESKNIRIHHIHMEEDAGKSIHDVAPKHSLIDLNRAGVPLLEIVTEPDLRSSKETHIFINTIRQMVRYLEISDGNMEEGSMRCDCNVSVRLKGSSEYGERCEIKNINSMRFAKRAIEYEAKRQIDLIESGGSVRRQTLNFDPVSGTTSPLREKEAAHDYRYFPEPDLAPIAISDSYIEKIKGQLPPLPNHLFQQFTTQFDLSKYNAGLLTEEKGIALFYLDLLKYTPHYKAAANLIINKVKPYLQENKIGIADLPIPPTELAEFIELIESGKVSSSIAYQRIFPALLKQPEKSSLSIAQDLNLLQTADEGFIEQIIDQAIAKYPDKAIAYRKGKKNLLGLFMGEVMRHSKGKADPKVANSLLRKKLEENPPDQ